MTSCMPPGRILGYLDCPKRCSAIESDRGSEGLLGLVSHPTHFASTPLPRRVVLCVFSHPGAWVRAVRVGQHSLFVCTTRATARAVVLVLNPLLLYLSMSRATNERRITDVEQLSR